MKKVITLLLVLFMTISAPIVYSDSGIGIVINGESQVFDEEPVIINERTMVPLQSVFESLGAEVLWDNTAQTATIKTNTVTVIITMGVESATVGGKVATLDSPAVLLNGIPFVPIRFICDAVGAQISWDGETRTVTITAQDALWYEPVEVTAIGDDGNKPQGAVDENYDTRWSYESPKAWLLLDFGEEKPLGYMGIAYYNGDQRVSTFDIEISKDGKEYTKIVAAKTADLTLDMTGVDLGSASARYVKYTGYGNSMNSWNSITELRVYPPHESGEMILTGGVSTFESSTAQLPDVLTPEISKALEEIRSVYDDKMIEYLSSLYDPEIGGFYYSVSARDNEGFLPDIESVGQMLSFLDTIMPAGETHMNSFGEEISKKILKFAQNMQDPDDGYFYHHQWGKDITISRRGRDLGWAIATINRFKGTPLYPTANERLAAAVSGNTTNETASAMPEYLTTLDKYMQWLKALPWATNAYNAGNSLNATVSQILACGYINETVEFLNSIQNTQTGLWGDGRNYMTASAVMKLGSIYSNANVPFNYADKVLDSLIEVSRNDEQPGAIVYIYNPWSAITSLRSGFIKAGELPDWFDEKLQVAAPSMILSSRDKLLAFKKSDGGFSYNPKASIPISQGATVSLGLAESDVNATAIGINGVLRNIYQALGIKFVPAFDGEDYKYFVQLMKNAKPVVKRVPPIGFELDFDDMNVGDDANNIKDVSAAYTTTEGSVLIAGDPNRSKSKVLEFKTAAGAGESFRIAFSDGKRDKTVTFEYKLYFSGFNNTYIITTMHGPNAGGYQLMFRNTGSVINVGQRRYTNETIGEYEFFSTITPDEWYSFRVELTPRGSRDFNVKVYIDGDLVKRTNKFYFSNSDGGGEPCKAVDQISFTSFASVAGSLYIDDMKVSIVE